MLRHATATCDDAVDVGKWVVCGHWRRAAAAAEEYRSLPVGVSVSAADSMSSSVTVINPPCWHLASISWRLSAIDLHRQPWKSRWSKQRHAYKSTPWFSVPIFALHFPLKREYIRYVLVILWEICMWLNAMAISRHPSSSVAAAVHLHCRLLLPPSAAATVICRCPHRPPLSSVNMSAAPHFIHYIRTFPPQNLSAIYPLQHPHIRILPLIQGQQGQHCHTR